MPSALPASSAPFWATDQKMPPSPWVMTAISMFCPCETLTEVVAPPAVVAAPAVVVEPLADVDVVELLLLSPHAASARAATPSTPTKRSFFIQFPPCGFVLVSEPVGRSRCRVDVEPGAEVSDALANVVDRTR